MSAPTVFSNAHNHLIQGGVFNHIVRRGNVNEHLEVLFKSVAPKAILNAGAKYDIRCHPGTRKEVIGRIEKWADADSNITTSRMLWLSGPAGAGKTAIMQAIAERCAVRGIRAANFFFCRSDASRNHGGSLVSTLLYQIFDFHPSAREVVEEVLASKRYILEANISEQFQQLFHSLFPLIKSAISQPIVLLIDGLDECDSTGKAVQRGILDAFHTLVNHEDSSFLVLVSSRNEHQITSQFRHLDNTASIFLDNEYSPQADIYHYVVAEFNKIKQIHPLAPHDRNWPSDADVASIVDKSSGQFLYAAMVMHSILDSPAAPNLTLTRVQSGEQITKSPFLYMDSIYTSVLSQAEDQETLQDIMRAHMWLLHRGRQSYGHLTLQQILCTYRPGKYTDITPIHSCIADVASIAYFDDERLIFYHASLVDYFLDHRRSGHFFVDTLAFDAQIRPSLLEQAEQNHVNGDNFHGHSQVDLNIRSRFARAAWQGRPRARYRACICPINLLSLVLFYAVLYIRYWLPKPLVYSLSLASLTVPH